MSHYPCCSSPLPPRPIIMLSSESPYSSIGDDSFKESRLDGRKIAARARNTPYQLEKLKFLACSILRKTEVENSKSVGAIYDHLLRYHAGVEENATETLCLMLKQVGCKFHHSSLPSMDGDVLANKDYQWRAKMIKYADDAKKQRKTLSHVHKTFDLESSTEDFSSPIMLFEHMIEARKLTVGEHADLERVEKATTSFRKCY